MRIRLTKISDAEHTLELVRHDGMSDSLTLASRSFLWHDLLHYAVETNAGLYQSFWGQLAGGKTLADLHDAIHDSIHDTMSAGAGTAKVGTSQAAVTEAVVGVLTDVVRQRATPGAAIAGLARLFEAQKRELPIWFSPEFVARVREHMRKLMGQWRAVPYGGDMQLVFPAAAADSGEGHGRPTVDQQKARPAKSPPRRSGRACAQ
jgi:hypothetical protein